jgi:hypothetical protein
MSVVGNRERAAQAQNRLRVIRGVFWALMAVLVICGYVAAGLAVADVL